MIRQKLKKKMLVALFYATLFTSSLAGNTKVWAAKGINVESHTKEEIIARISDIEFGVCDYGKTPSVAKPYAPGTLSVQTEAEAIKTLNAVRYIAGIENDVTINDEYSRQCQAGMLINYVNNSLSHFPDEPKGMTSELYELGYKGTSSSNIAWASWSKRDLPSTIINGWMNDGDTYNFDRLGHRRWILNPYMKKTGFGSVWGDNGTYSAVYAFDNSRSRTPYYGIAWPAQNMPLSFFGEDYPWSVSIGRRMDEDIRVTLTRKKDGKTWNFQKGSKDFNIDNAGYGQVGCIIFRPDKVGGYKDGDEYNVKITGSDLDIEYGVTFFSGRPIEAISLSRKTINLKEGQKDVLYAEALPEDTDDSIIWKSADPLIARVNSDGVVTGVAAGKTVIICQSKTGKVKAECVVKVSANIKKTSISSIKGKKKSLYVKWKSVGKANGYQVRYSTNSGMKNAKIKATAKTSVTIKNLKAKKKYYVQIRAYRKLNNGKSYGGWSSKKSIKTK